MPSLSEAAALVVLLRTGARPWREYAELVEANGSAIAVLQGEHGGQGSLFAAEDATADAAADVESWQREGMRLLTVLDHEYPRNLRAVRDRPPLMFVDGRLHPGDARSLAVIGARQATSRGREVAVDIAEHLVDAGYAVVSGLASGIDTAAHTATLGRAGRTLAVIGTGLKRVYPPQNAALQRRIAREGAVVSQFWPDAPPTRRTFPMRNAVMSGMTLGSVIVEASLTSGSRLQARLALEQGRHVFLHTALLEQDWARELAERSRTHVFSDPHEITDAVDRLTSPTRLSA
jgi:DNA processing protein